MNVNDLICVGARPVSLVDYIAVEKADAAMLDGIAAGLAEGARQANISISGGEIAQLRDVVRGFDLVGTAVGTVPLDRIIVGRDLVPGDVVIGIASSGIHSNGLTLARRVLFDEAGLRSTVMSPNSAARSARSCCARPLSTCPRFSKCWSASRRSRRWRISPATGSSTCRGSRPRSGSCWTICRLLRRSSG